MLMHYSNRRTNFNSVVLFMKLKNRDTQRNYGSTDEKLEQIPLAAVRKHRSIVGNKVIDILLTEFTM